MTTRIQRKTDVKKLFEEYDLIIERLVNLIEQRFDDEELIDVTATDKLIEDLWMEHNLLISRNGKTLSEFITLQDFKNELTGKLITFDIKGLAKDFLENSLVYKIKIDRKNPKKIDPDKQILDWIEKGYFPKNALVKLKTIYNKKDVMDHASYLLRRSANQEGEC